MTKRGVSLFAVLAMSGMLAAGCGDDAIPLDELEDNLRDRVCRAQVECGDMPDLETCRALFDSNLEQLISSIDEGRVDYDGAQAQRCLELLEAAQSECSIVSIFTTDPEYVDVCNAVFTGLVEPGGACFVSEECAGGECEVPSCPDTCCVGTCVAVVEPEPVAIGQDCTDAPCVPDGYCEVDDATGSATCVVRVGEGQECVGLFDDNCAQGLFCDSLAQIPTCKRPAAEGETCDPEFLFGVFSCERTDNWCDPVDATCKPRALPGEACDVELDNCVAYAECGIDGLCIQLGGLGDSCDQIGCMEPLECSAGICTADNPAPVCSLSEG